MVRCKQIAINKMLGTEAWRLIGHRLRKLANGLTREFFFTETYRTNETGRPKKDMEKEIGETDKLYG